MTKDQWRTMDDGPMTLDSAISLLCSTGAFSRSPDYTDYRAIMEYGPELDVDGFEVIFYSDWYDNAVRIAQDLRESGLRFRAVHAEKSIGPLLGGATRDEQRQGLQNLISNCRLGSEIGAQFVVLHLWGLPASDLYIERNLSNLEDCLSIAEDHGLQLAIETVPCVRADPLSNIRRAVDIDDRCKVTLDTEYLVAHNQLTEALDADWLWQGEIVVNIHIKDYKGKMQTSDNHRQYLHPGEGDIDFPAFFKRLKERSYSGVVSLEASAMRQDGHVDMKKLEDSLAKLRELANPS